LVPSRCRPSSMTYEPGMGGERPTRASGATGTLVPPRGPHALAEAVAELLGDPDLRLRYARAGRRRYVEHFTARRMAEDTLRVYEDVLAQVRAPVRGPCRRAGRSADLLDTADPCLPARPAPRPDGGGATGDRLAIPCDVDPADR
jgi:hypothetical protein